MKSAWFLVRNFLVNALWFYCMTDAVWPWLHNAAWFLQYLMIGLAAAYVWWTFVLLGKSPYADAMAQKWHDQRSTAVGKTSMWITWGWVVFCAAMGWYLLASMRVVLNIGTWLTAGVKGMK